MIVGARHIVSDVVTGKVDVCDVIVPEYEAVDETADNVADDEDNEETEVNEE